MNGREVMRIQNMQYAKKKISFVKRGSLVLYESGIAFYKAKGAAAGVAAFGLVGAFATRNNEKSESEIELPFSQIQGVKYCLIAINPALEVTKCDGTSIYFISESRLFNGKADLEKAANYINSQIRS